MNKLNKTFKINPLYESDGYKIGHKEMLAPNVEFEYFHWIPRSLKYLKGIEKVMSAGQQIVVRYLHSHFQENFFDQPESVAIQFANDMNKYLGLDFNGDHFVELHKLGYLPIKIAALPEGTFTKQNIPHLVGMNTVKGYAWLGLFLETLISKLAWQTPTSATLGFEFKKRAVEWTRKTDSERMFLTDYMCHDFHSRGGNPFTSIAVGLGHALSNKGSDTLNVIPAARYYYDVPEEEVCIESVNASEHSVTCTGIFYFKRKLELGMMPDAIKEYYSFDVVCEGSVENPDYLAIAEWLNLRRWLGKFPKGILSVVSDTFDLWKLITFILPRLKKEILSRDGKLVIRPDSGDPVDIICGVNPIYKEFLTKTDKWNDFFVELEDHEGEIIKLDDEYYEIKDVEDFIREYGTDQWSQVDCNSDDIFYGGSVGVLERVDVKPLDKNIQKGVVELIYDIFGGTRSNEGYIQLPNKIGVIYGDSINLERQLEIYERLAEKGFASTNVVLGIGSFTYVYQTRDTLGFAAKGAWFSTNEDKEEIEYNIFKDPITDDGTKKSLRGFQFVQKDKKGEIFTSECNKEKSFSEDNLLKVIYDSGKFYNQQTLQQVRDKVSENL